MKNKTQEIFEWACDTLENSSDAPAFQELAERLGISAFVIGDLDLDGRRLTRAASTMPSQWLEEYVQSEYSTIDPFLVGAWEGRRKLSVLVGQAKSCRENGSKAYELNHGLKKAGYERLDGYIFDQRNDCSGRIVSICFENAEAKLEEATSLAFASVLNSFFEFEVAPVEQVFSDRWMGHPEVTPRQRDAILFLMDGHSVTEVAFKMGVSETMVHRHLSALQRKTGARTREQMIAIAIRYRLV